MNLAAEGLPEDWSDVVDETFLRSGDRSFVFPGTSMSYLLTFCFPIYDFLL